MKRLIEQSNYNQDETHMLPAVALIVKCDYYQQDVFVKH